MSNPFRDQLLKTGIVSKQQAHNAKKDKTKKNKQQRSQKEAAADETKLKIQQAAQDKARLDRELNKEKEQAARIKAISAEINQLITKNCLARQQDCEIAYNFEHMNKVKHIYINNEMKQKIISGALGIAYIDSRYELVPKTIAEKIQQRDEKRIILFDNNEPMVDKNDPYAEYTVPDDLIW